MTDLTALAEGLTEKQRACMRTGEGSLAVCRALKRKGLVRRVEGTGMAWVAYPVFTQRGHELAHLLKGNGDA